MGSRDLDMGVAWRRSAPLTAPLSAIGAFLPFFCYTALARLGQASGPVATHRKPSFQCSYR